MHIGWNWIKQRPHYIAEGLSDRYDVTVISDYNYHGKSKEYKSNDSANLHIHNFYKLPGLDHFITLSHINDYIRKRYYHFYLRKVKPDILYVMYPKAISYIPNSYKGIVIYDCMDDMLNFTEDGKIKIFLSSQESKLIHRADQVFASSNHLAKTLCKRYGNQISKKITLVRNAYEGGITDSRENTRKYEKGSNKFKLCYFGTVASWFNFDFVLKSLDDISDLTYLIVGPIQSGTVIPKHPRLQYVGAVQHDKLYSTVKDSDAFVMPFVVNELIQSVDPVKLYEYIDFNKNIICIEYPEIKRFEKFVYYYSDYNSYKNQIISLMKCNRLKYSSIQRKEFLSENTWGARVNVITRIIEELKKNNVNFKRVK